MLIKKFPGKKRPVFIRQPVRWVLALFAEGWLRLEQRWEDNPGFVAAAAAGSLGLLLTAAMLINAGLGWMQDPSADDEFAAESPELRDSGLAESEAVDADLGEASRDEMLVFKERKTGALRWTPAADNNQADDDESGDGSEAFADSRTSARSGGRRFDDDFAEDDADDSTETTTPVRIAKTNTAPQLRNPFDDDDASEEVTEGSTAEFKKAPEKVAGELPVQRLDSLDDDDSATDEPAAKGPLPEMRVASQPQVLQPLGVDDEEESSTADTDQLAEKESKSPSPEPGRLKAIEKNADVDDRRPQRRSIDLVQGSAEKAVPREEDRWKQQRTKSVAERDAPAVAARQSRPVETKIFAAPQPRSVQPRTAPVARENRAQREKSTGPLLRLVISGPPSVGVGKPCQIEIRVTNTSSVPAHHLVVSAELPEGLVHEVAQSLEQNIETLAPGATYRALLRLRGEAIGEKTIRAEVESGDRAALQLSAKVRVTPASEGSTTIGTSDCYCAPLVR